MAEHRSVWGVLVALVLSGASVGAAGAQTIIRVDDDAPPGGDGATWGTAYRFLQDALAEAAAMMPPVDVEIRVAQGTYRPDESEASPGGTGDRTASFELLDGVALLGGFAGLGTPDPDQRDLSTHESVLTGDLLGDDDGFANNGENSYHVVRALAIDSTGHLEGFVVRGGNADTNPETGSGGMLIMGGAPMVRDCSFISNTASYAGGAIGCGSGALTIVNCLFASNNSDNYGGTLSIGSSVVDVVNCTITGSAAPNGPVIWGSGGGTIITLRNCIVHGNDGTGGLGNVTYSDVEGGYAGVGNINADPQFVSPGTGDYRLAAGSPCADAGDNGAVPLDVTTDRDGGTRFFDDPARVDTGVGGMIPVVDMGPFETGGVGATTYVGPPNGDWFDTANWIDGQVPDATTSVAIAGSVRIDAPGAVAASVVLAGGGVLTLGSAGALAAESLTLASGAELAVDIAGAPPFGQITLTGAATLAGTLSVAFTGGFEGSLGDDFTVLSAASIVGAFATVSLPAVSEGLVIGLTYAGGAVTVRVRTSVLFVSETAGPGARNGATWSTAYTDLQTALADAAINAQTIDALWIAAGTYIPSARTDPGDPRSATFDIPEGLTIYGGFAGGEASIEQRDFTTNISRLDGDIDQNDGSGVTTDNAYQVVTLRDQTAVVTLDGVTIRGGNGTGDPAGSDGTAMLVDNASVALANCVAEECVGGRTIWIGGTAPMPPTVVNCTLRDNTGSEALYIDVPNATVSGCILRNNNGSALNVHQGPAGVTSCLIAFNSSYGLLTRGTGHVITNCKIIGNSSFGANLAVTNGGTQKMINCLVEGNSSGVDIEPTGVGLPPFGTAILQSCTIAFNERTVAWSLGYQSGVTNECGFLQLRDSIVWGNTAAGADSNLGHSTINSVCNVPENILVSSSLIGPGNTHGCPDGGGPAWNCSGTTCVGLQCDPLFVDPDGPDNVQGTLDDNLHLTMDSPAVDRAGSTFPEPGVTTDCDGNPRVVDGDGDGTPEFDTGAFEYQPMPVINDTTWVLDGPGGFFNQAGAWDPITPDADDNAHFDGLVATPAFYTVAFNAGALSNRLIVESERIIDFSFQNASYDVVGDDSPEAPSIVIGHVPGLDVELNLSPFFGGAGQHLSGSILSIADGVDSLGEMTITGDGFPGDDLTYFGSSDLYVGRRGTMGILRIEGGARASIMGEAAISVGTETGTLGDLTVTGAESSFTYEGLSASARASVTIGDGGTGTLTLVDGGTMTGDTYTAGISIGRQAGAMGDVSLDGPGTTWTAEGPSFTVGEFGDGALSITNGASLITNTFGAGTLVLAKEAGSAAVVTVSGAGSIWSEQSQTITVGGAGTATVTVLDGGVIEGLGTTPVDIDVTSGGVVNGNSTFRGTLLNLGRVEPGVLPMMDGSGDPIGALTIDGEFRQRQVGGGGTDSTSGRLFIDLGGAMPSEGDALVVTGTAELGGGLIVDLVGGYQPAPTDQLEILTASSITSAFDVAFFPGLQDGTKFLNVQYGQGLGPGGNGVSIVVQDLGELFDGFEDPESVGLTGVPTGAAMGDFNGDLFPDIAVAIPDASPANDGSVVVLLNAGTDMGGSWLGFGASTVVTVGREPSGVAVGDFDQASGLDVAVSNAGDDDVTLLLNNGGGMSFTVPADIVVGDHPSAIAAADFAGDGNVDLAVANQMDNNVMIIENAGSAMFNPPLPFAVGTNPVALDPHDVDDPKDIDYLAVVNAGDDSVSVIIFGGLGPGTTTVTLPVGASPVAVRTEDLDRNGLTDIVVANQGDDTVSVILNDGGGSFRPAVNLPVGDQPRSITALDVESDGDQDIAVVADVGGMRKVQILRNDQPKAGDPLVFASASEFPSGMDPVLVLDDDLDADGADDLVTVNAGSGAGPGALSGPVGPGDGPAIGSINGLPNSAPTTPPCPADLDASGDVAFADLLVLLGAWGPCPPACPPSCAGDLNADCTVSFADLLVLLGAWGACP